MARRSDSNPWRQFFEAGAEFREMSRTQAQRRAREMVRRGELAQERVQAFVDDLVRTSRKRAEEFTDAVRDEVDRQLHTLGIATRRDVERLERRIAKAEKTKKSAKKSSAKKKTAAKHAGAGKTRARA